MTGKRKGGNPQSGAVGGSATGSGTNYHVRFAVFHVLDLIGRALTEPRVGYAIHMERRTHASGEVSRWDLGVEPGGVMMELKTNPTRADVLEWVQRSRQAETPLLPQEFVLVHNEAGPPVLRTIRRLIDIAGETDNPGEFQRLVALENLPDADAVITLCGSHQFLRKLKVQTVLEDVLVPDLENRARLLAGDSGELLVNWLTRLFLDSFKPRAVHRVATLITHAEDKGITLQPPPLGGPSLPSCVQELLFILQRCKGPLPEEVLREATECGPAFNDHLSKLAAAGTVQLRDDTVVLSARVGLIAARGPSVLTRALNALVTYVAASQGAEAIREQKANLLGLIAELGVGAPQVVGSVFPRLDKILKRLGDHRLVLDIAKASIAAARAGGPDRENDLAEYEVRSLICGTAWVKQRIGDVQSAREDIEFALRQATDLRSVRNVAFGTKCLGRLLRMEAERLSADGDERGRLLNASADKLKEARTLFTDLSGADDPEVGDCWSLLGRTLLVAHRHAEAVRAIRMAEERLIDPRDKDHWDLQILIGDMEVQVHQDRDAANRAYGNVIAFGASDDPDKSEILARAQLANGRNRQAQGHLDVARKHFAKASEIWTALQNGQAAAEAEAESLRLEAPREFLDAVRTSSPMVQVAAWKRYSELRKSLPQGVPLRQSTVMFNQILSQAQADAAKATIRWG